MKYLILFFLFFTLYQNTVFAKQCGLFFDPVPIKLINTFEGKLSFLSGLASSSNNLELKQVLKAIEFDPKEKVRIEYLLDKYKFKSGMSYFTIELFAVELLRDTSLTFFSKIIPKYTEKENRKLIKNRLEVLLLAEDISGELNAKGIETKKTSFRKFNNKVKKMSSLMFGLIGFGAVDIVSFSSFNTEMIALVREKGFDEAYPLIKTGHPIKLASIRAADSVGKTLTAALYATIIYVSTFMVKDAVVSAASVGELVYNVSQATKNLEYSHTVFLQRSVPRNHYIYKAWEDKFYEAKGRKPNFEQVPTDESKWHIFLLEVYTGWSASFEMKYGRVPDLKINIEDRTEWYEFVNSF